MINAVLQRIFETFFFRPDFFSLSPFVNMCERCVGQTKVYLELKQFQFQAVQFLKNTNILKLDAYK